MYHSPRQFLVKTIAPIHPPFSFPLPYSLPEVNLQKHQENMLHFIIMPNSIFFQTLVLHYSRKMLPKEFLPTTQEKQKKTHERKRGKKNHVGGINWRASSSSDTDIGYKGKWKARNERLSRKKRNPLEEFLEKWTRVRPRVLKLQ